MAIDFYNLHQTCHTHLSQQGLDLNLKEMHNIENNLNIEISDKNMNYLINNSKRDIKTVFKTLSKLEIESLERKKSIGLNLIKEVIQSF